MSPGFGTRRRRPNASDFRVSPAIACKLGLEGIVSKRKGSPYRSGRSPDWLKMKNPESPAVKREAEEDWR
jgi:ATP-dependent DNA ligase